MSAKAKEWKMYVSGTFTRRDGDDGFHEARDEFPHGIVQLEAPLLVEHHHRDARHRLAHRRDPEDRVRRHRLARLKVHLPVGAEVRRLPVARDVQHDAADFLLVDLRPDRVSRQVLHRRAIRLGDAPQLAQRIEAEGLEPFAFSQSHKFYTAPLTELMKCVGSFRTVNGEKVPMFKHDGNPFLAWQLGNCEVFEDVNGNIKVRKNEADKSAKVDGIIALIISMHCSLDHPTISNSFGFRAF